MKRNRNDSLLIITGFLIVCLIMQIVDIFIYNMEFIQGSGFGIIVCIIAIILNLVNYLN